MPPIPVGVCSVFKLNSVCSISVSRQWYGCQCWGFLRWTPTLMHAIARRGCTDTVRESALEVDSGRKILCRTGNSNPCQCCAWLFSWTFYQLSYSRFAGLNEMKQVFCSAFWKSLFFECSKLTCLAFISLSNCCNHCCHFLLVVSSLHLMLHL